MPSPCLVKRCRRECEVTVIGVDLCEKHFKEHCDGKPLSTLKGLLTYDNNQAVLK